MWNSYKTLKPAIEEISMSSGLSQNQSSMDPKKQGIYSWMKILAY